jgi:DNA-binding NarL/FixJ family response regulator
METVAFSDGNRRLKVVIVDDHRMMREALVQLLQKAGTPVLGAFANGHEAMVGATRLRPSVVVMDVAMPVMNGIVTARQLNASVPGVKVVALSVHADRRYVTAIMEAGAVGYVSKKEAPDELQRAMAAVIRGETYLSPCVANGFGEALVQGPCRSFRTQRALTLNRQLTQRERDVLELLSSGQSSKEIAHSLRIAVPTVETHRRQIMDKVGLRTIAELTKYAIRAGLTSVDY